jgi:RNA polymerase sigma-70 factor (ECF subfamily)
MIVLDPDAKTIRAVIDRDEKAFEKLIEKYKNAVFNTIYRYIGALDDAEDIFQEVFIKVWHKASSFKGKSRFSTWLYRIVANECLAYRRKHKHKLVSLDNLRDAGVTPRSLTTEMNMDETVKTRLVRKAISALPQRQKLALVLFHYDGYTYKEIACIMRTSVSSVEALIHRAKQALKKQLITEIEKT